MVKLKTRLKLSLISYHIGIKVMNIFNSLIKEFPSITSVKKYFNISNRTVSIYLNIDVYYKGFIF